MANSKLYKRFTQTLVVCKVDEERRIVKGPVLRPEIRDRQKSVVSHDEIEQAAHSFLIRMNRSNDEGPATGPGLMHEEFDKDIAIVESWVTDQELVYPQDGDVEDVIIPAGTWMMAMKIYDDTIWAGLKNKTFKGFSIGGYAEVVYDADDEQVAA